MGVYPLESPLTQAIRRARLYREGRLTYLFVRQQVQDDFAFRVADERTRTHASVLDEGAEEPPVSFARRQEGQTGPVLVVRADAGPTNFDKGGNDG